MISEIENLASLSLVGVDIRELVRLYNESVTSDMSPDDEYALIINLCSSKISIHPDYDIVSRHFLLKDLYRKTSSSFSNAMHILHDAEIVSDEFIGCVDAIRDSLDMAIVHSRDMDISFFGLKTLLNGYVQSVKTQTGMVSVERPQFVYMRVAVAIHGTAIKDVLETYDALSKKYFIHATPTLFNAGSKKQQLSSCFLMQMKSDSIDGIFDTVKWCALISKFAGGIGIAASNVRSKGSHILGTNGTSDGIIPLLRVFNATGRYVNQAGKRNGSISVYMEPWHADIEDFLQLRKNYGNEEMRARDLFMGLWVPDLFMERVRDDGVWSLMNPGVCPGLSEVWGSHFTTMYEAYEKEGKFEKQVSARFIWNKIIESQLETGQPYMLYKDTCNFKSNQKNLGTLKGSNLCAEIVEYVSSDEVAVCNLASIGLPTYVKDGFFNFDKLHNMVKLVTRNLNKIIDKNYYPIPEARRSNLRNRPIGIGIQGWADTLILLGIPFESPQAVNLCERIAECMYRAAIMASIELAEREGPYDTFHGSPASYGALQFDLWGVTPRFYDDWEEIKDRVRRSGLRNSLLIALMPTASTSQIMGFNEAFEPFTSLLYKRKTLAGEFVVINKYLVEKLQELGLWSMSMREKIIVAGGSIAGISEIPEDVRELFKICWEIKQRHVMDLAAARGAFTCQSQSMNLFMQDADFNKLNSAHFYSWNKGLKTGVYYLRTRQKASAQKFTVEPTPPSSVRVESVCTDEICTLCSA